MSSWPTKKLAEVADVIRGVSFDKSEVVDSAATGYTPILRAGKHRRGSRHSGRSPLGGQTTKVVPGQLMKPGDVADMHVFRKCKNQIGKECITRSDWRGSVGSVLRDHSIPRYFIPALVPIGYEVLASQLWRNSRRRQGANIQ